MDTDDILGVGSVLEIGNVLEIETTGQPQQGRCLRTCLIIFGVLTAISCISTLIVIIMFGAAVNEFIAQFESGDLSGMEVVTITTGDDYDEYVRTNDDVGFYSHDDDGSYGTAVAGDRDRAATSVADAATIVADALMHLTQSHTLLRRLSNLHWLN